MRHNISLLLGFLISLLVITAPPALAIGPGTGGSKIRVSDEKIGPYVLLVATSPLPVTVGQMSVWVRVTDANNTSQLRRDATVTVTVTPRDGGSPLTAQATHQNAGNEYDYVAHFDIQKTGEWDVNVVVQDDLGEAKVAFVETVGQGLSASLLLILAVPFVILAVVVGIYLWRRSAAAVEANV